MLFLVNVFIKERTYTYLYPWRTFFYLVSRISFCGLKYVQRRTTVHLTQNFLILFKRYLENLFVNTNSVYLRLIFTCNRLSEFQCSMYHKSYVISWLLKTFQISYHFKEIIRSTYL